MILAIALTLVMAHANRCDDAVITGSKLIFLANECTIVGDRITLLNMAVLPLRHAENVCAGEETRNKIYRLRVDVLRRIRKLQMMPRNKYIPAGM